MVFDFDRLSKDDRIGQFSIPLESVDFGASIDKWVNLDPPVEDTYNVRPREKKIRC